MRSATAVMMCIILFVGTTLSQQPSNPPATDRPSAASPSATPTPTAPQTPKALKRTADGKFILEDSTPVRMRTNRNLSSADAKVGDRLDLEVLDEVRAGDVVFISQGAIAMATVTEAQEKRRMGRAGKLNVNIDSVKLANGEKAALRAVKEAKGGGHVGAMTGAIVATSLVLLPAAPLFLFMHGKDITIPKGTEITAYVNGDTIFVPLSAASPSASPASAPELNISSTPDGADIEIDGVFAGSTPSKVATTLGDHIVTVKKSGFEKWERKMHITGGAVNIRVEFEKKTPNQDIPGIQVQTK
jgi:hypothetical protein